jgi:VWFA-related protein
MKPFLISLRTLSRFFLVLPLALALPLSGQGAQNPPVKQDDPTTYKSASVLRATTRLVVVDVVAIDDKGVPVTGLKAEDFTVLEDGKPQTIRGFSFQTPGTVTRVAASLPPGVVTNAPQYGASSCLNVILLDAVNTDFSNRAYAQDMLIKYLETSPAIQPTAVYALDSKLTMLHDFTTDTKVLRDVMANFRTHGPEHIQNVEAGASAFGRRGTFKPTDLGREATFYAMSFLAKALAGYPGRKNLIWLSDGFPVNLFPDATMGAGTMVIQDYSAAAERIADALMNAQVALYPIDAAGVSINDRFGTRTAMVSMSDRTGGKTFYSRNDIDLGVRTSIDDGATYYTLDYYPQNRNWDSKFRHIEIKLTRPGVQLRYRQGYYAQVPEKQDDPKLVARDFTQAMLLDAPPSTGVLFQAAVTPASEKTGAKRTVIFAIDPHTVAFERGTDELQHVNVTCVVWAYPAKGDVVRAESDEKAAFREDVYQQVMRSYFPCKRALDLNPGHYTLRLGVLDRTTNLMGTTTTQITVP